MMLRIARGLITRSSGSDSVGYRLQNVFGRMFGKYLLGRRVPKTYHRGWAISLPAVSAAVDVVSRRLAALPLNVYDVRRDGSEIHGRPDGPRGERAGPSLERPHHGARRHPALR